MIGIDSKHYPETLGRMFLINAPGIFSLSWALIKPFLDERTQRKIEIISSPSAWKKRLREAIDPRDLPVDFGGDLPVQVFPGSRTKKTNVSAGAKFSEATDSLPAGTAVRFRWFCRPADVSFAVRFVRAEGGGGSGSSSSSSGGGGGGAAAEGEPLHEKAAHPASDKEVVDVVLTAPAAGKFVATWSNKQGWWARDIFHRWDEMVGGKPKPCGGLTAVSAATAAGKPMEVISAAPPPAVVAGSSESEGGGEVAGGSN